MSKESQNSQEMKGFCYLKGFVDCKPGRVQDCNTKRLTKCPKCEESTKEQSFCFLKGLVDCTSGRVQDCNMKRVTKCMLNNK